MAIHLSSVLGLAYEFPIKQSRVQIVDHPEIKMIALLVVAAKLCYPLNGSAAASTGIKSLPRLNWEAWKAAYKQRTPEPPPPEHEKYADVTATQVADMSGPELDDYLAYLANLNEHKSKLLAVNAAASI